MHKCLIVEDTTTMTFYEIDTFKMYNMHKCMIEDITVR